MKFNGCDFRVNDNHLPAPATLTRCCRLPAARLVAGGCNMKLQN